MLQLFLQSKGGHMTNLSYLTLILAFSRSTSSSNIVFGGGQNFLNITD